MKLYDNRFAPSPRRVRFLLAEKSIQLPSVVVDIATGAAQTPAFRKINPLAELPVLELDDGSRLTESLAICRYLESLYPEPNLLGRDARETAEIEMWTLRLMFRLYVPTTQVFRNTHSFWAGRIQQVPEYGELMRNAVIDMHELLDGVLAKRQYLAGERFTMADIVGFTSIDFGKPSNLRIGDAHPNLKRWYAEIGARPAAKA